MYSEGLRVSWRLHTAGQRDLHQRARCASPDTSKTRASLKLKPTCAAQVDPSGQCAISPFSRGCTQKAGVQKCPLVRLR